MASRVAFERGCKVGEDVGYQIRFEDKTSSQTSIKYVTDGILVRECLNDPNLTKYHVVILDEAHERSLDTDILFTLVKQAVLRRRGSLRLVITSATLRTSKISEFYQNCPLLSVSGRCYPVQILHNMTPREQRVDATISTALRIHLHEPEGDVLCFLTGFEECEKAVRLSNQKLIELGEEGKEIAPVIIVSLYGSQSP
jgi:ATP-dependent RNA helicase DHX8/PRP22